MPDAITIPGAVAAWSLLHKEHGYMPWKELFYPAINYAANGIMVHERVALDWSKNTKTWFFRPFDQAEKHLRGHSLRRPKRKTLGEQQAF